MKLKDIRWGAALGGMLVTEIVMIAAAFGWVAIYSYLIHPGESPAFYKQYAMVASPWVSLITGIPIFYFVCRWIGSHSPARAWPTAMAIFGIFFAVDLVLMFAAGSAQVSLLFLAINYVAKFFACHFGGRHAANKRPAVTA